MRALFENRWLWIVLAIGGTLLFVLKGGCKRDKPPRSSVVLTPVRRVSSPVGTQQVFGITNRTDTTLECVLARFRNYPEGFGTGTFMEVYTKAKLAPWMGTELILPTPTNGGAWRAMVKYRRVMGPSEINVKAAALKAGVIGSNNNHLLPEWRTETVELD